MPCDSLLPDPCQRAQRLHQRHLRVRPVQQQQVDLGQAQSHQAFLGRTLQIMRREMRRPDLGGEEDLIALHARGAQALADLAFVLVHLRGVDVAIAEPQRLLDDPRAGASAQFPGAQPDRRNSCAIGFEKQHRLHPRTSPYYGLRKQPCQQIAFTREGPGWEETRRTANLSWMRSGWAATTDHLAPRTQAAWVLRAGAHSTLHGVVFAILCPGPAVYR